jgi:hypothetical protein
VEVFVGTLAVAVLGGVLAFAREQIKNAREDVEFYRSSLLPAVEKQQDILEKLSMARIEEGSKGRGSAGDGS